MDPAELAFPLVPRARLTGLPFGALPSWRRGRGSDVAGSRPYLAGDDFGLIDWASSARLSAARGSDEFVVREHFAEEAPCVVVVADRRPAMALYSPESPFLDKSAALRVATTMIAEAAAAARGLLGYLDFADGDAGHPFWVAPRGRADDWLLQRRWQDPRFAAPEDNVELALEWVGRLTRLSPRRLVRVRALRLHRRPARSGVVDRARAPLGPRPRRRAGPGVEQSFPELAGIVLPVLDAADGTFLPVRLTRREADERRARNEQRLAALVDELETFGLDAVVLGSADPAEIHRAFSVWAEERLFEGGHA